MKLTDLRDYFMSQGETMRKDAQKKRMLTYMDNFEDQVKDLIDQQFHPDNRDRLYPMVVSYVNMLKKIVNLKSFIYKQEASRAWVKADGETVDERFDDYVDTEQMHVQYQTLNKYVNINNTGFMRLIPDAGKIRIEAVPSQVIGVYPNKNNPMKFEALVHYIAEWDQYLYWDAERWGYLDAEMKKFMGEEKPNTHIHPDTGEGVIPYVPFWSMQPMCNSFWNETMNSDLHTATIQLNANMTHFNNLFKNSSYRQWVFTGLLSADIKQMYGHVMDGANPITISGEQAEAKAEKLVDDLKESIESLRTIMAQVADQHGVEIESQSTSAQKSSGFAIKLRKETMNDLQEEQEPLFRRGEREVAEKAVVMANSEYNANIDVAGNLRVTFAKDDVEIASDEIGSYEWQLEKGLMSVVDLYQMTHPDLSPEEVEEQIKNNIQKNAELTGTVSPEIAEAVGEEQDVRE